jgi:hypothetical protein
MSDNPTLVRFVVGFEPDGVAEADGMPIYREVIKIVLSRPPYLEHTRVATEDDFENEADAYKMFVREQKGLKRNETDGYPLALWPAISPSDLQNCLHREIYTVEQLAKLALGGARNVPPPIVEIAKRAKRMIELQKETGRHEARISELEGQIGALREQNNEFRAKIEGQNTLIATLQARAAA